MLNLYGIVQIIVYLAIVVFVVGVAAKVRRYATAPMHLRWELYPVPHDKGRAYGGSYLEAADWWAKPRETSFLAMVAEMLSEMLLIKTLWHKNRSQWFFSFPFHVGLYFLIAFVVLLIIGALVQIAGAPVAVSAGFWSAVLVYVTLIVGVVGLIGATIGALGLLYRRLTDPNLRVYSTLADYFNLVFLLAIFVSAWVAGFTVDGSFSLLRGFFQGLITANPTFGATPVAIEVLLVALFMLYLPFTHMTHFVGKFFTWHQVRWDDAPNLRGDGMSRRIAANLQRPLSWSAPHIQKDKRWVDVAQEETK